MALAYSTTLRNSMLDAITTAVGASGKLRIYDGARPATGGAATTLLVELPLSATFAPASSGGVLTANAITSAVSVASSTATGFRIVTSGGAFVYDGSVAAAASDLNLSTTTITSGVTVAVSSLVITEGNP